MYFYRQRMSFITKITLTVLLLLSAMTANSSFSSPMLMQNKSEIMHHKDTHSDISHLNTCPECESHTNDVNCNMDQCAHSISCASVLAILPLPLCENQFAPNHLKRTLAAGFQLPLYSHSLYRPPIV